MDVGDWLRGLGLSQYEATFRESEIDADVLPDLTEIDLERLGVPLGHRKRLLKAIASLGAPENMTAAPTTLRPRPDAAERRQLTVMFCDLVGSTVLSARLDPEDMSDLIRAFQGTIARAVARFDGHVAKLMGDGALVYFGYPRAHEDDAERAVRAGLGLVEAVRILRREQGVGLEVRVGVATGLVVVGELMGEGEARERGVIGETPNLAARLQGLAEPGSVVIAESTRRLLGGMFELKALGPQTLKGFAAPVSAWSVVREAENVSRFEASRSAVMTPFVGREHELALLLDRWRDATEGKGQVVLLSGEAGIGKSRFLVASRERIGGERHVSLRYQCSPHHANDAFYPIIGQIWHAAGFAAGEPAAARLKKLKALIALSDLDAREVAPYLASLLSIPAEGHCPALEMAPSELKEHTIAALIALFTGLTRGAPVLALLEDAHWIDPTSLDVFGRLVERLQALPALFVVTFRPEFAAPWVGRAHVTALALNRLGQRQAAVMIDRVTGGKALPSEVLEHIVAKTDGVPLFVEELTKTVLESGLLREDNGSYVLAAALTPLAIPSTLQDSLMARLDRLAPIKEIAQIGAAIGREFSYRLLEAVSPLAGPALQDALSQLMASELVHGRGAPPEATYLFKHALVQDTAYASLLRSPRQRIHADIAKALADRFAVESAPAIIAHHYTEAGLAEPAARYWLAAAELALSRSANAEAARYVDAGLALIPRLTDGPERQSLELGLQLARANSLLALKGYNAPEMVAALIAAKRHLDTGVGTNLQRFSVLYGLCFANMVAAQLEPALTLARQIVEVAGRQDDTIYRVVGYRLLGTLQFFTGQNREALQSLQLADRYRDPARQRSISYRFAIDPGLAVLCYKILALMFLGLPDRATRVSEEMRAELPSHGHAPTVASCKLFAEVSPEALFGDLEAYEHYSAELVAYCAEKKVEQIRLMGAIHHNSARAMREPTEKNIVAIRAAIEAHHRSGGRISDSLWISQLAVALLVAGDVTGAEEVLQECFAFVEQSGERFWLAELHRLHGQVALKRPKPDRPRAEACFLQAIEIARRQEARMLELRAATDLAQLWRDTGTDDDPRALLEPILAVIEGGETTRDVRNARSLLTALV
ncbi:SAM domain (Sterile alpha motif) [Rhizobiales bacterium GAS191]|nr:SAM domain (Sterile alpha motif) [Rhizobiales bacterium GAS191]